MKRTLLMQVFLMLGLLCRAQVSGDVLGSHNLSLSGTSPVRGALDPCLYCHVPHSGVANPNGALWSQTLSTQTYKTYGSTTLHNTSLQPMLGGDSSLCLSCHDGTVAVGQTQPFGQIQMSGNMYPLDKFGNDLQGSHPFSLKTPMVDASDLVQSLTTSHTTADPTGAVKLINNDVECTSCHTPHAQMVDTISKNFLVRDSSNGQMCLACHEVNPRTVNSQSNPLAQWSGSIHATTGNAIANAPLLGSYSTVAQNACLSCHMPHNSVAGPRLLRGPQPPIANLDSATQNCMTCHNGGSNISPVIPNVYAEFSKIAHPYPSGVNTHDAAETPLLNNNRHATCVDCHSPHASLQQSSFASPLPPAVRPPQNGAVGISATDGVTVVNPSVNQYENCLRCHGNSTGKQTQVVFGYAPLRAIISGGDGLNVITQMNNTAASSHPVMHDRSSALAQPSLLGFMLQQDGKTQGRAMGTRIYCTDCHNSDDNREFGGPGPNGPHGSKWTHLLERRYELSQASAPGQAITNLYPNPDFSVNGPYAMCGKCHDLPGQVDNNTSWAQHSLHINDGFSCSVCHTSHGMTPGTANVTGERLVNFDINVVAPNGSAPITYDRATNSCSLVCHNHAHTSAAAATKVGARGTALRR